MAPSSIAKTSTPVKVASDDRREWIRIDDQLLLEYRLLTGSTDGHLSGAQAAVTPEMIASAVGKPTTELLARSGEALANSPLLPWVMKVDWLLEGILKALVTAHPGCVDIARVMNVNISSGGISFVSTQPVQVGDQLEIKVILPPFTPVRAVAKVIRSSPSADGQGTSLATEFVDLKADDQEHLIRYIIQTQAERLRARRNSVD